MRHTIKCEKKRSPEVFSYLICINPIKNDETTDDTVHLNFIVCATHLKTFSPVTTKAILGECRVRTVRTYIQHLVYTVFALNSNFSSVSIPPAHQQGTMNPAVASVVGYCATIDGGIPKQRIDRTRDAKRRGNSCIVRCADLET